MAAWVETTLGVEQDPTTSAWTRRRSPLTLVDAAAKLSADCGEPAQACRAAIERLLQIGSAITHPDSGGRCSRSGCTSSCPRATTCM